MLRKSPLLSEHQDWFALHESGKISHTYSRSIDMSNPDYQKHLLESLRMYLRDYHVDGFRLDAQHWNNFPNWDPSTGRRPYEMLMAGMRMIDDIRSELKKEFPDVHFYTESSGILTGRAHDYRYNYDTYWALWGALTPIADQRTSYLFYYNYAIENTLTWPDYAQWYEEMRASMAGNMVIVNHVDSHDYHERTRYVGGQYGRDLYGLDMHRVLFGMVAFLDGGVMSYYGAQRGSEQYYSKILELRSSHDVFRNGEFSATQVETDDPKTIAIFWKNAYEWGIYLGNLEHKAKKVRLRIKDADDLLIFNRYNVIDHLDKRRKVLETTSDALREGVEIELVPAAVHVLEGLGF